MSRLVDEAEMHRRIGAIRETAYEALPSEVKIALQRALKEDHQAVIRGLIKDKLPNDLKRYIRAHMPNGLWLIEDADSSICQQFTRG